jgi:DNA-binding MarR family transcriptional regulator
MGELQQNIIKHLFECKNEGVESVSHISRALKALQPAVHRSVKVLEKEGYVVKEKEYDGGVKGVALTSKGGAAAIVLGASPGNKEAILKFNGNYRRLLQKYFEGGGARERNDPMLKEAMRFILQGKSADKWKGRMTELIAQMVERAAQPQALFDSGLEIKQLVEEYDVDKNELRKVLEEKRQQLDSLIGQLK